MVRPIGRAVKILPLEIISNSSVYEYLGILFDNSTQQPNFIS